MIAQKISHDGLKLQVEAYWRYSKESDWNFRFKTSFWFIYNFDWTEIKNWRSINLNELAIYYKHTVYKITLRVDYNQDSNSSTTISVLSILVSQMHLQATRWTASERKRFEVALYAIWHEDTCLLFKGKKEHSHAIQDYIANWVPVLMYNLFFPHKIIALIRKNSKPQKENTSSMVEAYILTSITTVDSSSRYGLYPCRQNGVLLVIFWCNNRVWPLKNGALCKISICDGTSL